MRAPRFPHPKSWGPTLLNPGLHRDRVFLLELTTNLLWNSTSYDLVLGLIHRFVFCPLAAEDESLYLLPKESSGFHNELLIDD